MRCASRMSCGHLARLRLATRWQLTELMLGSEKIAAACEDRGRPSCFGKTGAVSRPCRAHVCVLVPIMPGTLRPRRWIRPMPDLWRCSTSARLWRASSSSFRVGGGHRFQAPGSLCLGERLCNGNYGKRVDDVKDCAWRHPSQDGGRLLASLLAQVFAAPSERTKAID